MTHRAMLALTALLTASLSQAATFRVRNNHDSGLHSLRWAIEQANATAGRDKILFAPPLKGKVIRPLTRLPDITDNQTIINGDIDGDGAPDVTLSGKLQPTELGLQILASRCSVQGLAVTGFETDGIWMVGNRNKVYGCHLGVNLAGTKAVHNGRHDLVVSGGSDNTVGGTTVAQRNIVSGGAPPTGTGILLLNTERATVVGNYVGLARNGMSVLGNGDTGIWIAQGKANTIGGTGAGEGNVVGGMDLCINIRDTQDNVVSGNYLGLMKDGNTLAPVGIACIYLLDGAKNNLIGGTVAGARNVFAGGAVGVTVQSAATADNEIRGNYFGTNAAGTQQRRLSIGVWLNNGCGPQIIGGTSSAAGNYFAAKHTFLPAGVRVEGGGSGTRIQHNTFGVRPGGGDASGFGTGVECYNTTNVRITDNLIARAGTAGVWISFGATAKVFRNVFRHCNAAVSLNSDGAGRLGDLSNASTSDDGGNVFRGSNTWFINNLTPNRLRAEGNRFGTTSKAAIDAKITDKLDNSSWGRVDYIPLKGGVIPTGEVSDGTLSITSASAVPTATGTQITFTLSSAASVSARILNIAGRPVRTLCQAKECESGTNTLLWNAQSDTGLRAPNGMYLIELTAANEGGAQARAVTNMKVAR